VPRDPFQYVVVRVVPSVERGEQLNAGVVLYCRAQGFLAARTALDRARLAALAPGCEPVAVEAQLGTIERIAAGDPAAGPNAAMPAPDRFGLLAAPASTVIQPSPIHTGLTEDPAAALEHLFTRLVA
jgi:hypothetical protein